MKTNLKVTSLLTLGLLLGTTIYGQKMMETSAASEYENKFVRALEKRDFTSASESILKAKEFIDQASINEETKNSVKTLYYKAFIYVGLVELTKSYTKDESKIKEYQNIANENMNLVYNNPNTKYKTKVQDYIDQRALQAFQYGEQQYTLKNYENATFAFIESNNIKKTIGLTMENSAINAEVSFLTGINTYLDANKTDEALKFAEVFKSYYPTNRKVLLSLIDIQFKKSNLTEYEKLTDEFSQANPNDSVNKKLYYNLATSYLTKKEFNKAESGYKKALSFDGMYIDAIYQLASTYISWAMDLSKEASLLPMKDPKVKLLDDQANKTLLRGISALEKYTAVEPTDKAALTTLYRAYSRVGNEVKATEVKAKADAIK